jgi:putative SOS response-associated peptidase YedK
MFGRRETKDPSRVLRLHGDQWRQGDGLRVTPRRRWDTDPNAKRMVIRRRDVGEFALTPMRWGLLADGEQANEDAKPLISVRAETIAGEIEWRRLLNTRRCLVPTDQFFEWKRVEGVKTREFALKLKSRRPMMIAALWNRRPAGPGKPAESFAYITCPANRLMSLLHDRMPAILDDAAVATWMNPDATLDSLLALMKPLDSNHFDLHAVAEPLTRSKPHQPSLFASRAA